MSPGHQTLEAANTIKADIKTETSEKLPAIVAAGRQTAAIAQATELSGFLPKAATPVLQRSRPFQIPRPQASTRSLTPFWRAATWRRFPPARHVAPAQRAEERENGAGIQLRPQSFPFDW